MIRKIPLYILAPFLGGIIYGLTAALPQDKGFKQRIEDFIREHSRADKSVVVVDMQSSDSLLDRYYRQTDIFRTGNDSIDYGKGDWAEHVLETGRKPDEGEKGVMLYGARDDEVNIISYGSLKFNLGYGDSVFTDKKYKQYDEDKPDSDVVKSGFVPEQEMLLHMEGNIGRRLTVYIDHDSRKKDNVYMMQYRAVKDDEVIREINAGMIDIKFNNSKYAVYDNSTAKGMGLDMTLKKKGFQVKAFASIMRGESEVEYFKGTSTSGTLKLMEYQYQSATYYQLEPFRRYDGITDRSSLPANETGFYGLVTFTSAPADPANFLPSAVNINPSGFALYMDDQDAYNNLGAIALSVDGGYYTRLQAGQDYSINYSTGLITFLRSVPVRARIFAVYNTAGAGTTTSDPSARTDVAEFPGKLFVFVKYGPSMKEEVNSYASFPYQPVTDLNGDGVCNLDIYEVRSYYNIGAVNILSDNFTINFYNENDLMSRRDVSGRKEIDTIGPYRVDYTKGIIYFYLREPFRYLLEESGVSGADRIYTESKSNTLYEQSRYRIRVDYYRDARTFQLRHFNIIPDSIRVKINGAEISKTLYTVDHTSGYLVFNDPNNPYINAETDIEIRYEYLPLDGQTQSFVGGIRADYAFNENFNVGGSVLYSKSSTGTDIPLVGETPTQTVLLEGDALLNLNEKAFKKIGKFLTKKEPKRVPVEFKAYGEYAYSIRDVNTFGKALIDNMESSDELLSLSMSEKDWIPASMPSGFVQADRAVLNYYYYRDPSKPETLRGLSYKPTQVAYSVKPGPFNVATGHVDSSILGSSSQVSMVMDFDFSYGACASIATRMLQGAPVDLSGLQYVEIWYRYEGEAAGDSLDFFLDLGKINEDSDGDGTLDTEDSNGNGYIDSNPDAGTSEDRGYEFNGNVATRVGSGPRLSSSTKGDGILNTEDIDKNGILDAFENVFTVPGSGTTPGSLNISASETSWKMARIYVDFSAMTQADIELLKQTEAVRLHVQRNAASTGTTGRLYIDTIKFVSSKWRNFMLGSDPDDPMEGITTGSQNVSVTIVNSVNDPDYRADAFIFSRKSEYTSLYGDDDEDLKKVTESAIEIDYSIPAGSSNVSFTQNFPAPLDLRFYKTMNLWINYRTPVNGEIGIVLGSSETDYRLYRFQVSQAQTWQEIRLKLKKGSSGSVSEYSEQGDTDMKRISFVKVVVFSSGNDGTFWLNDMYVSQPEKLQDDAHWFESELKITEPLIRTDKGTPVFSDLYLKYVRKGHGAQFSSVSQTSSDMAEQYDEFYSSFNILPKWSTTVNYVKEESKTDSLNEDVSELKRGETVRNSVYVLSDYASDRNAVPSVRVSYKYDDYDNLISDTITDYAVRRNTIANSHAPSISLTENIDRFLWGKLNIELYLNMLYKSENIERESDEIDGASLSDYVSLEENEKRQKTDTGIGLNYQCKAFYLKPQISFGSEEIVSLSGRSEVTGTEINSDVRGDYHFPYDYTDDFKFVDRNKKGSLLLGTNYCKYLSPFYLFNIQYQENKFGDYPDSEDMSRFDRDRDSRSYISTQFSVPINLSLIEKTKFIKNMNVSYGRSVYCSETDVPYEGEDVEFYEEKFGPKRSVNRLLGMGMDVFRYYPFYNFVGRDNFANGRDYVYHTMNKSIRLSDGSAVADYSNQLRVIENFSLNWSMDFDKVVIDSGGGLDQICERQNLYGIPQQTVTWNLNLNLNFDLMKLFDFWFFRPNREGIPHHASTFELGYAYENRMIVTSNIEEHVHSPLMGLTFKWDRASIGVNFSVNFRIRNSRQFIPADDSERAGSDDIYFENMSEYSSFVEDNQGYNLSVVYETDVKWIYNIFAKFYKLTAYPIYRLEYTMNINRYDYSKTVSPEPYDLHLINSTLTLDLHKYVQGGFYSKFAVEQYRSRTSDAITREVFSYEIGLNISLMF